MPTQSLPFDFTENAQKVFGHYQWRSRTIFQYED